MSQSFDVIVIGGGIVGLSAAAAMSQLGIHVALIDAGPLSANLDSIDPRVYAINHASQSLLQSIGAWDRIEKSRISPYQRMHVWDSLSQAAIDFDARMVGRDRLGTILEESVLKQALLQQISTQNICVFPNTTVTHILSTPEAMHINTDKATWQAKLLIVADGAMSTARKLLNIPMRSWPYHQHAIVTLIRTEKPHERMAYQVFHPDGPLAFLPLSDPHLCSIVWSISSAKAQTLMALADEPFAEKLAHVFEAKLGSCKVMGKRHTFPLHMRHTKQYSGSRWVLMGDAAHTIHPLAGLGLNIGLADLNTWLSYFNNGSVSQIPNKVLGAYQRQRQYDVWQMIALMGGLKALFSNPFSPVVALRGLGLSACHQLLPLKQWFIAQASK